MRRASFTVQASAGGTSYSPCYVPDFHQNPFGVSLVLAVSGATGTVQHTLSDPFAQNLNVNTNGTWMNHEYLTSATTSDDGNYAYPVTGIRLAVGAGTGEATLTIVQGEGK